VSATIVESSIAVIERSPPATTPSVTLPGSEPSPAPLIQA
jgi:hypothetical protein